MVHEGHLTQHQLERENEILTLENNRINEKMTEMVRTGIVKEEIITDKVIDEVDPLTGEIVKILERKDL